jgi:cobalamin biosynthetic protein CobC
MRDHGGNIDWAKARWGEGDWIDLSTGINRRPYPVPPLPPGAWTMLPTTAATEALLAAARTAWTTDAPGVALAGAQAAIQMIPRLGRGKARILAPTYNEHAGALRDAGWQVEEVAGFDALSGADLAVIVNPNNPDGRRHAPADLLALADRVGRLVVDESFADPEPALSLLPHACRAGLIVLRSFGKFWGLAGLRLGFAFGDEADIAALARMAGPWPVSGAALEIGRTALADTGWREATIARLAADARRLDGLAETRGWRTVGGTTLFRLFQTDDAAAVRAQLAGRQIWSRIFPWSAGWLRLGLPGDEPEWRRLAAAIAR